MPKAVPCHVPHMYILNLFSTRIDSYQSLQADADQLHCHGGLLVCIKDMKYDDSVNQQICKRSHLPLECSVIVKYRVPAGLSNEHVLIE